MYNSNELPKRRKIEPDEFADLLCSGEMVMIREPDLDKHPKHRIYRYSPKDIFVYQPKVNNYPTSISYDTCFQGSTDRFVQKIRSSVRLLNSRSVSDQARRSMHYGQWIPACLFNYEQKTRN